MTSDLALVSVINADTTVSRDAGGLSVEIGTSESFLSNFRNSSGMLALSQTSSTRVALVFDIALQNSSGEDLLKAAKSASRHSSKRKLSVRVQKTACRDRDEVVALRQSAGGGHLLRSYLCCDWVVFEGVEKSVGGHVVLCREADVLRCEAMSCLSCCVTLVFGLVMCGVGCRLAVGGLSFGIGLCLSTWGINRSWR